MVQKRYNLVHPLTVKKNIGVKRCQMVSNGTTQKNKGQKW